MFEWRTVFFTAAGFYFIGNLLFVVLGKTDVQCWNSLTEKPLNNCQLHLVNDVESPVLLTNGDVKATTNHKQNGTH